ncbi:GNAT superfamily N-acetyltransferase [Streptomyces sp. V3I8]|uniref:GNAT family N-acetyltransferase n=1 Tax=Streptomyces sp. V3I8 TaxID=3042279 RepID=UPI00277D8B15|nr:GNAT family N-acetyltransferase [Streptomyces sp. V3I8]MDQ1041465.1 GNAT superfamily N-acetyltransferase [Streptomyces sp. V3I8]
MTDISATSFFRQAAETVSPDFEHEESDTGGSKRPTKIHLHALDPDSGDRMGTLTYHVPRRKADKILIEHVGTDQAHRGKGVASALMDEMQRRHPATPIDHGDRTDAGKGWWKSYTNGKSVSRGRTMAAATKPCPCCSGTGEHNTGFECFHCDGGLTVPADSPDDATCDGRLPDGGHGKTAATSWDVPDHVSSSIHRGLTLALTPEDHAHVHDRSISTSKRSLHVLRLATERGGLGRHWSTDPDMASHFSHTGASDLANHPERPHLLSVTLHAHPPKPEHIERDPEELGRMGVQGHVVEKEVPLTRDAPVRVHGVDWQDTRDFDQSHRFSAGEGHKGVLRQAFITPVPDNDQPYEHEHGWLPRDHFFEPTKPGLDPRLFDGDRMRPEVRQHLLSLLHGFWAPKYGDSWQSWARVYLAGSEASHFLGPDGTGNGDLDVLIGIDYGAFRAHVSALADLADGDIDTRLTDELRRGLNDDARMLPGPDGKETGPWESTWYVNPGAYDIRAIKPYAAYDITRDEWAVKPVETPADFGPEKLPESTWGVFEALQTLIKAIAELPAGTREREGAALYDYLHGDRHAAFGPDGTGLYDPANATWKALDKAPGKPLQQLIDWKHAHDGATTLESAA